MNKRAESPLKRATKAIAHCSHSSSPPKMWRLIIEKVHGVSMHNWQMRGRQERLSAREIQTKYLHKCDLTSSLLRFIRLHFGLKNSPEEARIIRSFRLSSISLTFYVIPCRRSAQQEFLWPIQSASAHISHTMSQHAEFLSIKIFLRFLFEHLLFAFGKCFQREKLIFARASLTSRASVNINIIMKNDYSSESMSQNFLIDPPFCGLSLEYWYGTDVYFSSRQHINFCRRWGNLKAKMFTSERSENSANYADFIYLYTQHLWCCAGDLERIYLSR